MIGPLGGIGKAFGAVGGLFGKKKPDAQASYGPPQAQENSLTPGGGVKLDEGGQVVSSADPNAAPAQPGLQMQSGGIGPSGGFQQALQQKMGMANGLMKKFGLGQLGPMKPGYNQGPVMKAPGMPAPGGIGPSIGGMPHWMRGMGMMDNPQMQQKQDERNMQVGAPGPGYVPNGWGGWITRERAEQMRRSGAVA